MYFSLFHSHLTYCLPVYSCTSTNNINSLHLKQKAAIRIITHSKYNSHTQPLFHQLQILPLPDIIKTANLHFIHSYINNNLPSSFMSFFTLNSDRTGLNYQLRNNNDFLVPLTRTDYFKRFPQFNMPSLWNSHPNEIKLITPRFKFKKVLKSYYLKILENFRCEKLFCYCCSVSNQ